MTDPQATEVAVDAVTGLVNMFKDAGFLYWVITLYSILIGAAMTYVGRRHFKKLLFFVGTAHATVNVAALLVNGGKDTTRLAVEFILRLGVANLFDGAASDGLQVDVCL